MFHGSLLREASWGSHKEAEKAQYVGRGGEESVVRQAGKRIKEYEDAEVLRDSFVNHQWAEDNLPCYGGEAQWRAVFNGTEVVNQIVKEYL